MRSTAGTVIGRYTAMLFGALLLLPVPGLAADVEVQFAEADWFERPVAQGVVWRFHHFDDLFNSRQSVSVLEADLNTPGVEVVFPFLADSLERTSTMTQTQFPDAVAAVNGTFFGRPGGSVTYVRINGETVNEQDHFSVRHGGGAVGVRDDGRFEVIPGSETMNWQEVEGYRDLMANGPYLVHEGLSTNANEASPNLCAVRHPRTVVGMNEDTLFLVTVDGRTSEAAGMTCDELSEILIALGATEATNMDGGGSTTLWIANEPLHNGVVNFPSDNGHYDRAGERSAANAIAVIAPPITERLAWDGRVESVEHPHIMLSGEERTMSVSIRNIGSATWDASEVTLHSSRPHGRASAFAMLEWLAPDQPVAMNPARVTSGEAVRLEFPLRAPDVEDPEMVREFFALYRLGERFGPSESEIRLEVTVEPPHPEGRPGMLIIESAPGGLNSARFDGSGWSPSGVPLRLEDTTDSGSLYASTFRSVVGLREGFFRPNFPEEGRYRVSVGWPDAGFRRNPVTYTVQYGSRIQGAMEARFRLDQTRNAGEWVVLGVFEFEAGESGAVRISNEDIDVSGSMYAGAAKFEYIGPPRRAYRDPSMR